jgi:hypothetical protein
MLAASWRRKVVKRHVSYRATDGADWVIDESKKVLGILYRTMKPLLEDFNPEMTNVYDDSLKGIPHEQYIQSARHLKVQYGKRPLGL